MTRARWREFWLPPSGPATLAAIRIIIALQALWILLSRDPAGISALPPVIWRSVRPDWQIRYLLVPGIPGVEFVVWVVAVASVSCVLVGYRTRIFGVVAGLLIYHLAPLQATLSSQGPWGKGLTIATLALPILACAPCEDRWSLAHLLGKAPVRGPEAYGWAVMLVRLLFAQIYLFTAIARLQTGGFEWVSTETVRNHLLVFGLAAPSLNTPLNAWLVAHPTVCLALAAATLLFELVFVIAVFVPATRLPFAVAGVMFHTSLWLTLGFRYPNLAHFLMFIDFDRKTKADAATADASASNVLRPPRVGDSARPAS